MTESKTEKFLVGKYVCPITEKLVPVWSAVPIPEMECPVIIEYCPACGEEHAVACDDLLETGDCDLE